MLSGLNHPCRRPGPISVGRFTCGAHVTSKWMIAALLSHNLVLADVASLLARAIDIVVTELRAASEHSCTILSTVYLTAMAETCRELIQVKIQMKAAAAQVRFYDLARATAEIRVAHGLDPKVVVKREPPSPARGGPATCDRTGGGGGGGGHLGGGL
jgi:hypothetical protein